MNCEKMFPGTFSLLLPNKKEVYVVLNCVYDTKTEVSWEIINQEKIFARTL